MAVSRIDIINAALMVVGSKKIFATTDNTKAARLAGTIYEIARNEMFGLPIAWKFATVREELTHLSTDPTFGHYDHQCELPSGCHRVIAQVDEGDDNTEYDWDRELWVEREGNKEIEHDVLLTSQDEVFIKYIRVRQDVNKWPAWFARLVILNLALYLCEPLKQDKQKKNQIWLLLYDPEEGAYKKAKDADALENVVVSDAGVSLDKGSTDVVDVASDAKVDKRYIVTRGD